MSDPNPADEIAGQGDEFDLINWIRSRVANTADIPVGIGDDCAALRMPSDRVALVTTDMLIANVHFRPEEVSPQQVGRKAIARGLSDIAAMAGDALAVVVALAAPKNISASYLKDLFEGMKEMADALGVRIVGGDIASGDMPLALTVTAIGAGKEHSLTLRSGASPGDMVMVTGQLGGSLLGKHLSFSPLLKEAIWLRETVALHGMIDISDGLAADAGHIATESRVAIELWSDTIPISRDAMRMAQRSGLTALEHALHDGEDYELLFTAGARDAANLLKQPKAPMHITCIGEVVSGSGLWIRERGKDRIPLSPRGWRHKF